MVSSEHDKQKQAIVENLISTCGLQRALHAAKQYGWHDIATQISVKLSQNTTAPHH